MKKDLLKIFIFLLTIVLIITFAKGVIISPNGGETISINVGREINWTAVTDVNGNTITYNLYYSNNSGINWYSIINGWGYINYTNSSVTSQNFSFTGNSNLTSGFNTPKVANITSVTFNITGFYNISLLGSYDNNTDTSNSDICLGEAVNSLTDRLVLWNETIQDRTIYGLRLNHTIGGGDPQNRNLIYNISICTTNYNDASGAICLGTSTLLTYNTNFSFLLGSNSKITDIIFDNSFTTTNNTRYLFNFSLVNSDTGNGQTDCWYLRTSSSINQFGFGNSSWNKFQAIIINTGNIFQLLDKVYPTNTSIEIGIPNNIYEWNYSGNFNITQNVTINKTIVQNYIDNTCSVNAEQNCSVPILLHSDSSGIMQISNINIQYTDYYWNTSNLPSLNTYKINVTAFNGSVLSSSASTSDFTINDCGTLTSSYTLTRNQYSSGTCFTIGANNLVLDCNNYIITGNSSGDGVNISNYNNVTVKNCQLINFSNGINLYNTTNISILNNIINTTISSNAYAILSSDSGSTSFPSNTTLIYNNTFYLFSSGINFRNTYDLNITSNKFYTFTTNSIYAILIYQFTTGKQDRNIIIDNNNFFINTTSTQVIRTERSKNINITRNNITLNSPSNTCYYLSDLQFGYISNNLCISLSSFGGSGISTLTDSSGGGGSLNNEIFNNTIIFYGIGSSNSNNGLSTTSTYDYYYNNTILIYGDNSVGISGGGSSANNNNYTQNNITLYGISATGISLIGSDNHIFKNNYFYLNNTSSIGVIFRNGGNNNQFINNVINSTLYYDIYHWNISGFGNNPSGRNNIFINNTFNKTDIFYNSSNDNGNETIQWYLDFRIQNSTNTLNISNANVTIYDVSNLIISSNLTNTNGQIPQQTVTEFIQNATTITYSSPYTININLTNGYLSNKTTYNLTLTNSVNTIIALRELIPNSLTPTSGNFGLNDTLNIVCNNTLANLNEVNYSIDAFYNHTKEYKDDDGENNHVSIPSNCASCGIPIGAGYKGNITKQFNLTESQNVTILYFLIASINPIDSQYRFLDVSINNNKIYPNISWMNINQTCGGNGIYCWYNVSINETHRSYLVSGINNFTLSTNTWTSGRNIAIGLDNNTDSNKSFFINITNQFDETGEYMVRLNVTDYQWENLESNDDGNYTWDWENYTKYTNVFQRNVDFRCLATDFNSNSSYYNPSGTIELVNRVPLLSTSDTSTNNIIQNSDPVLSFACNNTDNQKLNLTTFENTTGSYNRLTDINSTHPIDSTYTWDLNFSTTLRFWNTTCTDDYNITDSSIRNFTFRLNSTPLSIYATNAFTRAYRFDAGSFLLRPSFRHLNSNFLNFTIYNENAINTTYFNTTLINKSIEVTSGNDYDFFVNISVNQTSVQNNEYKGNLTINLSDDLGLRQFRIPLTIKISDQVGEPVIRDEDGVNCDTSSSCDITQTLSEADSISKIWSLRNNGNFEVSLCNAELTNLTPDKYTFTITNFNVPASSTRDIGVIISKLSPGTYSTELDVACKVTPDGFTGLLLNEKLPFIFLTVISRAEAGQAGGGGGGGGITYIIGKPVTISLGKVTLKLQTILGGSKYDFLIPLKGKRTSKLKIENIGNITAEGIVLCEDITKNACNNVKLSQNKFNLVPNADATLDFDITVPENITSDNFKFNFLLQSEGFEARLPVEVKVSSIGQIFNLKEQLLKKITLFQPDIDGAKILSLPVWVIIGGFFIFAFLGNLLIISSINRFLPTIRFKNLITFTVYVLAILSSIIFVIFI